MSRRSDYMKRNGLRKQKSARKRKFISIGILLFLLAGIALAGSIVLGFNPFLETQLKAQFGEGFFTDFNELPEIREGGDLKEITDNYQPAFTSLERQALKKLDELFDQAVEEYYEKDRDGTFDRFLLTNKYIQAGRMLENNVDETFYELLDQMEAELTARGFPTEVTAEIEQAYEEAKEDKKRDLFKRLRRDIDISDIVE